jgi:hypothetical protein
MVLEKSRCRHHLIGGWLFWNKTLSRWKVRSKRVEKVVYTGYLTQTPQALKHHATYLLFFLETRDAISKRGDYHRL